MTVAFRIALVGAECTGKTELCRALCAELDAVFVPEALRAFVDARGRVPSGPAEMLEVATAQRAAERAAVDAGARMLVCDTTPLLVAVYSQHYFGAIAPELEAMMDDAYDVLLLAGDDIPWVADGLQRDGEPVRRAVQRALRACLDARGVPYDEIVGYNEVRTSRAFDAVKARIRAGVGSPR